MERQQALQEIEAIVCRCERILPKFAAGSAQHSLLIHRIDALKISHSLLLQEGDHFSGQQLQEALPPVRSILHKCSKAREKFAPGKGHYHRLTRTIQAMQLAQASLEQAIETNRQNEAEGLSEQGERL